MTTTAAETPTGGPRPEKRRKLVLYGMGDFAELVCWHFDNDSDYEVVAFTVDRAYLDRDTFCGRPVVAFDEITNACPPDGHDVFVCIGYSGLNAGRVKGCAAAKRAGYTLASFVSSAAIVMTGLPLGENVYIEDHVTIQPGVHIGDGVIIMSQSVIAHHARLDEFVFISVGTTIAGTTRIGRQCFIGAGAVIRDHIEIGERCIIGGGATILESTEPLGVYRAATATRLKRGSLDQKI